MTDADEYKFERVRRMSATQIEKLSKKQLLMVLRDAVNEAENNSTYSPTNLKAVVADAVACAVADIRNELLSESKKLIAEVETKFERNLSILSDNIQHSLKEDILNELENRDARQNNIVIFGLPEPTLPAAGSSSSSDEGDKDNVLSMFSEIGIDDVNISRCFRLGQKNSQPRPRPLKVILKSREVKELVLSAAPKLSRLSDSHRFRKVFIKVDLTPLQQEQGKLLRQQLRSRKEAGEDVVIRNGRIVLRSSR